MDQNPNTFSDISNNEFGRSIKLYNPKMKLNVQAVYKRGNNWPTINVEIAPNTAGNWDGKISLQVHPEIELPEILPVLLGRSVRCEFSYHGPNRNKGYSFTLFDDGSVHVQVSEAGRVFYFRLSRGERFHVASLVLEQLSSNSSLSPSDTVSLILSMR
ncbi:hypothetical protein A3715_00050 [Oleiphilus sp. HI0009]|nr:hypothetical protein A3715_00050 [Oleiphilus sp. HI0009]